MSIKRAILVSIVAVSFISLLMGTACALEGEGFLYGAGWGFVFSGAFFGLALLGKVVRD